MAVVGAFDYSQMPAKKEVQFVFKENRTGELKKNKDWGMNGRFFSK